MIHDIRLVYSEERDTWNLFVDGEWYYEGNYDRCIDMMETFYEDYADDDYVEEPYDEPYYYED